MTDALAHRGPDGEGVWQNEAGHVLLGHRRLSILDLSTAGQQPMHFQPSQKAGEGQRYTIVHNGEIYNYSELKEELQRKGYTFHSQTDTEVIAAAYDCWKDNCIKHFDGMFAFAIWDEKEKELFAARDRFGEKPFFYFFDGQHFLFASEMKALWAAGVEKTPNQKMLFNFITIGYVDNPARPEETFYENIYKLPPASLLKFSSIYFQYSIGQYWNIDLSVQQKNISDTDALEQFNQLLTSSVRRRLRSDVPVGSSLSGGVDSSSVSVIANSFQHSGINHSCFTAIFPGFEKDELAYAQQITAGNGFEHFTVDVKEGGLLQDWDKICYYQEEPFGSASIYAQYKVYELAKQHNTTVLLDGQGADETLAGYHKYYKWYWQELFRNRKLSRSKELQAAKELGIHESFTYKNKIAAYFPAFASIVMERQYLLQAIRQEDLTKSFVQEQSKEAYYTPPEHFDLNGVLYFNTCTHGLEELLRYADRNSMAHGREVRLPFLAHELVEFVFSLPANFKIRHGWTKWLLRESMKNKLPASITWRKDKVGFEPPQKKWMAGDTIQAAIRDAKEKLVNEKILKADVLQKPITPQSTHDGGNYDWRYFSAAMLFSK